MSVLENSTHALNLIRKAAREYNNADFKFYKYGYFKYKITSKECLIEDIYIEPEFRGTPMSSAILKSFETFMRDQGILFYYGLVFKQSSNYQKRLDAFTRWGMNISEMDNVYYTTVSKGLQYV